VKLWQSVPGIPAALNRVDDHERTPTAAPDCDAARGRVAIGRVSHAESTRYALDHLIGAKWPLRPEFSKLKAWSLK
jgi:hypothetical protein